MASFAALSRQLSALSHPIQVVILSGAGTAKFPEGTVEITQFEDVKKTGVAKD